MKNLILLMLLVPTFAFAQEIPSAQQHIEKYIGKLVIENATLATTVENLNKQISDLKKQLEEAKQKDQK